MMKFVRKNIHSMIGTYENDDALISSVHFTTLSSVLYVLIYVNRAVFAQCRFTVY